MSEHDRSETAQEKGQTAEAFARLQLERDRLRQLIDSAPNVFYVVDEETRVLTANRAAAEFYGIPLEKLVGHRLTDIFGRERADAIMGETYKVMDANEPCYTPEDRQLDAGGKAHYWELFETPIFDVQTGKRAVLGVANDITARREHQRMKRDLEIAREIQLSLLPSDPPTIKDFEVAGWSEAAEETGGDYFDWLTLADGRTLFALADVTGHGIGPALVVAVFRAYMRAAVLSDGASLVDALSGVNDLLHMDLIAGRFVTAAVGFLDPERHEMSLVSAGHGPLLFHRAAQGKTELWNADALPLGIAADLQIEHPRLLSFQPGDTLVLTTDGFFEWMNSAGKQYGIARLTAFVNEHAKLAPSDFIEALHREVLHHAAGHPQQDDLTAVVIKRSSQS